MMKFDVGNLLNVLKEEFTDDATEIIVALELLNFSLSGLIDHAHEKINQMNINRNYTRSMELLEFVNTVSDIHNKIKEYSLLIDNEESETEGELENISELDETNERETIPDYSKYVVDRSIPHTLYENFTHKKATAFSVNNKRYEAKDWKDLLVQTCNLLAQKDPGKFYDFLEDPDMKGTKLSYFSTKHVADRNAKLKDLDIYVWTNLSANNIVILIRKILKKLGYKIGDYYVYLRADYTALHETSVEESPIITDVEELRIGDYVRQCMRKLSKESFHFSDKEISSMQSKRWSKMTLDVNYPFLKKYNKEEDISSQIRVGIYGKYWKELFRINGMEFFITNQWYDKNREPFRKWFESLF